MTEAQSALCVSRECIIDGPSPPIRSFPNLHVLAESAAAFSREVRLQAAVFDPLELITCDNNTQGL